MQLCKKKGHYSLYYMLMHRVPFRTHAMWWSLGVPILSKRREMTDYNAVDIHGAKQLLRP